ncbi:MAG TPA: DUF2298 domain-containing protein, partial [Thermomicrobiales bacterium]|nr:DUF2298 domain-containing protein [Thermomicrobiales bacterium]
MDWFNLTLRWYLLTTASTIALAPIALWLCSGLVDRGASVARPIAALVMIWPIWYLAGIGSGIVPFSVAPLWVALVVIGAASWAFAWRIKLVDRITIRHLLIAEIGFLLFFALYIWFHGYGPQITDQEKPGDMMMLASSMRSTQMPPNDAWMAGDTINYYYLGYVIWAAVAKMVGATPWEAFNLTLATTFGITCVGAAGLAANIAGRWLKENVARLVGLLGLLFVVFMGNPWAAFKSLDHWSSLWKLDFFSGIGWPASRVIHDVITTPPDTIISEFPAFSFILADLHPHLLTLPFAIVSLSLGWALLQGFKAGSLYTVEAMGRVVLTGGIIGALYAMNSWDMPTYLVLAAIALVISTVGFAARERVVSVVVLAVSAVIAWLPFYINFTAPTKPGQTGLARTMGDIPVVGGVLASIVSYHGSRTSAIEYLDVFGFVWVIAVVLIAAEFWNRRHAHVDPLNSRLALGAAAILILGALLIPMPVLALAGLPVVATVVLIQRDPRVTIANVALGLFSFGF